MPLTSDPYGLSYPPLSQEQLAQAIPQQALGPKTYKPPEKPPVPVRQPQHPVKYPPMNLNAPPYGGYSGGGFIQRHLAAGGNSTYGLSNIPMLPVGQGMGEPAPLAMSSPAVSTPTSSPYIAAIGSNGLPSYTPQTPSTSYNVNSPAPAAPTSAASSASSPGPSAYGNQRINKLVANGGLNPAFNSLAALGIGPNNTYSSLTPDQQKALQPYLMNKGGGVHMASGGLPDMADMAPWYAKRESTDSQIHTKGLFNGPAGGRTDTLNKIVPAGAYVLPADVVSGLGEGNTMAGANVLDAMMHSMPYGIKGGMRGGKGMGIPHAPAPYKAPSLNMNEVKRGGAPHGSGHVPVVVAGGEYLVSPEHVKAIGNGNLKQGHAVLDHLVVHVRKKTADTLKKLPGPKK